MVRVITSVAAVAMLFAPAPQLTPRPCRIVRQRALSPRATEPEPFDINQALTAMNAAVANEDYAEAARLKKLIADAAPASSESTVWPSSLPEWLRARLEQLDLRFPTPVQSAALRCDAPADVLVRAPTGSGKTISFLSRMLSGIDKSLQQRSAATTAAVSDLDLPPTMAMNALAPSLSSSSGQPPPSAMAVTAIGMEDGVIGGSADGVPRRGPPLGLVIVPRDMLAEQVRVCADVCA